MAAAFSLSPCIPQRHCRFGVAAAATPTPCALRLLSKSAAPRVVSAAAAAAASGGDQEAVFFDGGPHYGDLATNLVFGLSLVWLPLTVAAVLRALFLRYRFSSARVTILSGLTGADRKDFGYSAIKDVKYVPRFIGEWGDIVITLRDDTQVELKSVPRFREIAEYCRDRAGISGSSSSSSSDEAGGTKKKGFL